MFVLKRTVAALIKLSTEKQLQSGYDFQKLGWSSEHCNLKISRQLLSEKFSILAGKKHAGCKHPRSNIKRELQKKIKAAFGACARNWNLHCRPHHMISPTLSNHCHICFESHIHSRHSLFKLTRENDHLISLLYCTVLQKLIEIDIQSECRRWKTLMFLFVFLWCCKWIGNPALFSYGRKHPQSCRLDLSSSLAIMDRLFWGSLSALCLNNIASASSFNNLLRGFPKSSF